MRPVYIWNIKISQHTQNGKLAGYIKNTLFDEVIEGVKVSVGRTVTQQHSDARGSFGRQLTDENFARRLQVTASF
jgi:hypothetical protein